MNDELEQAITDLENSEVIVNGVGGEAYVAKVREAAEKQREAYRSLYNASQRLVEVIEGKDELDRKLAEFTAAMKAKFVKRRMRVVNRYGLKSVTDADFDWISGLNLAEIDAHMREEIAERLQAETYDEKMDEDVDVANMVFLDWTGLKSNRRQDRY